MYAVTVTGFGGPEVMTWSQVPDLYPQHGQVLIDVAAAGVTGQMFFSARGFTHRSLVSARSWVWSAPALSRRSARA